jgi:hypothetical protein
MEQRRMSELRLSEAEIAALARDAAARERIMVDASPLPELRNLAARKTE